MKRKGYSISINKPCQEDWASMSTTEQGKYCASCAKNVIDFTRLTDAEIILILQNNKGNICGRAKTNQLNRILTPQEPKPFFRPFYKALAGALVLAGTDTLSAHTILKPGVYTEVPVDDNMSANFVPDDNAPKVFKGKVTDGETGDPVNACTVYLKNSDLYAHTNGNGNFEITIPEKLIIDTLVFEVIAEGYDTINFNILKKEFFNEKEVTMCYNNTMLRPLVVTSIIVEPVIMGGVISAERIEPMSWEMILNHVFH